MLQQTCNCACQHPGTAKIRLPLEPLRQQKIREGLKKLLEENVGKESYDGNRLEQELIYYIEKIDISEEQVRLQKPL
jgi:uncharacterized protein YicC (UPF0701 family)